MNNDNKSAMFKTSRLSEEDLATLRSTVSAHVQRQVALLLFHRDGVQVVPLIEGRKITLGRTPPADIAIRDDSLSRQHAQVEMIQGVIWIEDLGSTNGTWLLGKKVSRCAIDVGVDLRFGAVAATVHAWEPTQIRESGVSGHDRFQSLMDAEAARALAFGRNMALVMIKTCQKQDCCVSHFFPRVQKRLRPFDWLGLYSPDTLEILLPEADEPMAQELAGKFRSEDQTLCCGVGLFPLHAKTTEELLGVTRSALQRASASEPIQTASLVKQSILSPEAGSKQLVVASPAMQQLYVTVERLASSSIPVLLLGETGTGKEVVARAIHEKGKRKQHPLICVNCGGIPTQLVESTLFGHERGAFTGALQQAQGVFESANGGTVLLDEIGELPAGAQAALLRVLEQKSFCRVGSNKEIDVDVRVLAATHRNLESMCQEGKFREDLFYRLNGMTLTLPPLRERLEEVEPLVRYFMHQASVANERSVRRIGEEALHLLRLHPWPGNVRELRNAIERAVVIAQNDEITVGDLPEKIRGVMLPVTSGSADAKGGSAEFAESFSLKAEIERHEAELILKALRQHDWDREQAAKSLGLPLRTLAHKMQEHGIKKIAYQKMEP